MDAKGDKKWSSGNHHDSFVSPESLPPVRGVDFDDFDGDLSSLLAGMLSTGGQATGVGQARQLFADILRARDSEIEEERPIVYLGYTANMVSCGLREIIKHMAQHKMVDAIVTTGGGIEEDMMKCMADTYVNFDYTVNDRQWRVEGKNRIGNMIMPNDNYVEFEEWFSKQYDAMVKLQKNEGTIFGPSDLIKYLGDRINHPDSIYGWCAKNGIEVFCPGITDGSLGDILYCKGFSSDNFIVDINKDLQKLMEIGYQKKRPLFAFIIGGGMVKYHILNATKMAGGLDSGIFISVGNEFDNSCSGAKPEQDVSRQAIKHGAQVINLNYDASIVVPLIVANQLHDK
jgi:deoxyhypusine synthase